MMLSSSTFQGLDSPKSGASLSAPMSSAAAAEESAADVLTATFARLRPEVATCLQPDSKLISAFAERGSGIWTYGEVTLEGCAKLMDVMLDGELPTECTFLDVGSGVGQIVLYAAAIIGVQYSFGIELVPSRHAVAEAARQAMIDAGYSSLAQTTNLRCGDALDASELPSFAKATHIFCANAVFALKQTAQLVAHVGVHAPRLQVLALLNEPPPDAVHAAGLVLVRASSVSVSWLHTFGWPVYLYRRAADVPVADATVAVDEDYEAASENAEWFSMV